MVRIFKLTNTEWYSKIAPSISKTFQACNQLLQDNHIDFNKLQKIYLYGGTCNIPYIEENLLSYAKAQFNQNVQIVNISKTEKDAKNIALYGAVMASAGRVTLKF